MNKLREKLEKEIASFQGIETPYTEALRVLLAYDAALENLEQERNPSVSTMIAREARQAAMKVMGIEKTMGEG